VTRAKKSIRQQAIALVEDHIRESGCAPGFDYPKAILDLRSVFADDDIAAACNVSKNTIGAWLAGAVPAHDSGERLYILYRETLGKKPQSKKPN
jgi:hypothetical protein